MQTPVQFRETIGEEDVDDNNEVTNSQFNGLEVKSIKSNQHSQVNTPSRSAQQLMQEQMMQAAAAQKKYLGFQNQLKLSKMNHPGQDARNIDSLSPENSI